MKSEELLSWMAEKYIPPAYFNLFATCFRMGYLQGQIELLQKMQGMPPDRVDHKVREEVMERLKAEFDKEKDKE